MAREVRRMRIHLWTEVGIEKIAESKVKRMDQLLGEIQEEWSEVFPFQPECANVEMGPYQV